MNDESGGKSRPDDANLFGQVAGGARRRPDDDRGRSTGAEPPNPQGEGPEGFEQSDAERALRRQMRRRQIGDDAAPNTPAGQPGPRGPGALPALRPEMRPDTPALRAERVEAIRRDLVRRRRRKGGSMVAKLLFFVVAPTMFVAWFLWFKATELYASDSVFIVQGSDSPPQAGGFLSALGGGRGGSGLYDSVAVQSFILSRDVLKRLDREEGFSAHFQRPEIDRLHRLAPDATFEDAFAFYKRMVSVSFDPSEGVLEMRLIATSAPDAHRFSRAIIQYAEEMVNQLADPIRRNALTDAETNLKDAENRLREAQLAAAAVRNKVATFSVEAEVGRQSSIVTGMEVELERLKAKLTNLRRVTGETDPRVERLTAQIETMTAQIAAREGKITGDNPNQVSLADINSEIERANFEVRAAMEIFSAAIQTREFARKDVARQHRYLSVVVEPSMADRSNYPHKWQTVGLAFLIFLGLYILASLTISLIREQASV